MSQKPQILQIEHYTVKTFSTESMIPHSFDTVVSQRDKGHKFSTCMIISEVK